MQPQQLLAYERKGQLQHSVYDPCHAYTATATLIIIQKFTARGFTLRTRISSTYVVSRLGISRVTLRNLFRGTPARARQIHSRAQPTAPINMGSLRRPCSLLDPPSDEGTQERGITTKIILTCNSIPGRAGQGSACA